MYCRHNLAWVAMLFLSASSAPALHAAERTLTQAVLVPVKETHALNPAQITAIRSISRNVLAAKKSSTEDGTDAAQLASLRSSLDALIATDLDPRNRPPITLQGQESGEQRRARERVANLSESARVGARALVTQLRQRSELKAAHARGTQELDTRSAGFPIGEQRARLFERWASKLDAALVDGNEDRAGQLRELRDQLQATKGSVNDASAVHRTPTLQAMPSGYVPSKNDGAANE